MLEQHRPVTPTNRPQIRIEIVQSLPNEEWDNSARPPKERLAAAVRPANKQSRASKNLELKPGAQLLIKGLTIDGCNTAYDLNKQSFFYGRELGLDSGGHIQPGSLPFLKEKVCIG